MSGPHDNNKCPSCGHTDKCRSDCVIANRKSPIEIITASRDEWKRRAEEADVQLCAVRAEVERLREELIEMENDDEDDKIYQFVRKDADAAMRKALGPCWNHMWGPELEELGRYVEAGMLRAERADAEAKHEADGHRDAVRQWNEAIADRDEWKRRAEQAESINRVRTQMEVEAMDRVRTQLDNAAAAARAVLSTRGGAVDWDAMTPEQIRDALASTPVVLGEWDELNWVRRNLHGDTVLSVRRRADGAFAFANYRATSADGSAPTLRAAQAAADEEAERRGYRLCGGAVKEETDE